jgi:hypothetical protein
MPPCPNSARISRTQTASAPKPNTSTARPPTAAKGPRQAHAMRRSSEGDREAVDIEITTRSASRPADVGRLTPQLGASDRTPVFFLILPSIARSCAVHREDQVTKVVGDGAVEPSLTIHAILPAFASSEPALADAKPFRFMSAAALRRLARPCHADPLKWVD